MLSFHGIVQVPIKLISTVRIVKSKIRLAESILKLLRFDSLYVELKIDLPHQKSKSKSY